MNFITLLFALGTILFFSVLFLSLLGEISSSSDIFFSRLFEKASFGKCFLLVNFYYSSGGGFFSGDPSCGSFSENPKIIFSDSAFLSFGSEDFAAVVSSAHYR